MSNLYYPLNNFVCDEQPNSDISIVVPPKPILSRDPSLFPRVYEQPINYNYYLYCVQQMTEPDKWSHIELASFQRTIDYYENGSYQTYPYENHPFLESKQDEQDELLAIPTITRKLTLIEQYVQQMPNGEIRDLIGNVLTTIDQNKSSEEKLTIFKAIQKEYEEANKV